MYPIQRIEGVIRIVCTGLAGASESWRLEKIQIQLFRKSWQLIHRQLNQILCANYVWVYDLKRSRFENTFNLYKSYVGYGLVYQFYTGVYVLRKK